MKLILPLVLGLLGTGGGVGAGLFLTSAPTEDDGAVAMGPCGPLPEGDENGASPMPVAAAGNGAAAAFGRDDPAAGDTEFARLNNQFVVPVVAQGRVVALVVLSLSLEVPSGEQDIVFEYEPKLRDAFLQVLFDHANLGGFDGAFTATSNMRSLRSALQTAAQGVVGDLVRDVLILELVRQDV